MTRTNKELLALATEHGPKLGGPESKATEEILRPLWTDMESAIRVGLYSPDTQEQLPAVEAVHALRNWFSTLLVGDPVLLRMAHDAAAKIAGQEEIAGNLLRFAGDTWVRRGYDDKANEKYRLAIEWYLEYSKQCPNGKQWVASCTRGLGDIAFRTGDYDLAWQHFNTALLGFRSLAKPDTLGIANVQRRLGNIALIWGYRDMAHGCFGQALNYYRSDGATRIDYGDCLVGSARLALTQGNTQVAIDILVNAIEVFRAIPDPVGLSRAYALRSSIFDQKGDDRSASDDQSEANRIHREELGLEGEATDVIR